MKNYKSLLRKIKKINKELDLKSGKHSIEDLPELIDRYTDNRIVDAFKIMFPKVSAYKNAFYNDDVIKAAFDALYPKYITNRTIKINLEGVEEMGEKDKKDNSKMNDFIRQQAGMPIKEDNSDENIIDSSLTDAVDENKQEDKKEDMNELIRSSRKSTTQELSDLFFKKSK